MHTRSVALSIKVLDAIKLFCFVINPNGKAFHPPLFLDEARRKKERSGNASLKFFPAVKLVLEKSYEKALKKHEIENPKGPKPKRITVLAFRCRSYRLRWVCLDGTAITLCISREVRSLNYSKLIINGKNPVRVQEFFNRFLEAVWLQ